MVYYLQNDTVQFVGGGVDGKAEAGNSVKQTPLVLCLNARARL